jgi:hypothetical protein
VTRRRQVEVLAAVASATCSAATGMTRVGEALRAEILTRLRTRYHGALTQLQRQRAAAAARARTVLRTP